MYFWHTFYLYQVASIYTPTSGLRECQFPAQGRSSYPHFTEGKTSQRESNPGLCDPTTQPLYELGNKLQNRQTKKKTKQNRQTHKVEEGRDWYRNKEMSDQVLLRTIFMEPHPHLVAI